MVTSAELPSGGLFMTMNTCAGNHSPSLSWTAGPPNTQSYAVVLTENVYRYKWAIWDIAPTVTALPADLPKGSTIVSPISAKQTQQYLGPCEHTTQNYTFIVYALDVASVVGLAPEASPLDLLTAIDGHVLEFGTLRGTGVAAGPAR